MAPSPLSLTKVLFLTSSLLPYTRAVFLSSQGQTAVIPSWKVQTSSLVGNDVSELSAPNLDTFSWYTIGPKATLMSTLLENGIYNDDALFFSTNLQDLDYSELRTPWYYRAELELQNIGNGSHFQLQTNGITSRADIWLNGQLVVSKDVQAGAYVGLTLDITERAKEGNNVLLVKVYPTDYNKDLALGFVDWNPYPPDNGTGIWRDVEVKRTGSVSISSPRVTTKLAGDVNIHLNVKNLEDKDTSGEIVCRVQSPDGKELVGPRAEFRIASKGAQKITLNTNVGHPQVWWPKQWGKQPLYTTQCNASTGASVSDQTAQVRFGVRTVTSTLSSSNDTTFSVNGEPFQVIGAGYTSDMFLRFDEKRLRTQFEYMLDMGLNTVRLEGKQEHPALYSMADELGLMVMAGWECCDKWEGWAYNDEGTGITWTDPDYTIANNSMHHEAAMMQPHPSMLTFLVGSDFWPDDRATAIYVDALKNMDWEVPIIASASQRGSPEQLGNGGMKMEGPYDWVPPNYWAGDQLGAAFGFGSELGAGVGTPELSTLRKFLSGDDQDDLWKSPNKGLYHMSTNVSSFYTREIYNAGLWHRYGPPTSLDDYLLKAQMMDYEATRAEFEGFAARWTGVERPATGLIYWMLNNAWPSLHWNLFDYYLHPAGSYFGTKVGSRIEHIAYDYASKSVYLINKSLEKKGARRVHIELLGLDGKIISKESLNATTTPNSSKKLNNEIPGIEKIKDIALLKLVLMDGGKVLSRNVYWLASTLDVLDWDNSTWYHTPVTNYSDFTALNNMTTADIVVKASVGKVMLENKSRVPAIFVRLNLIDGNGNDVVPVVWEDNYVTLWPGEKVELSVEFEGEYSGGAKVEVSGKNIRGQVVGVGG